MGFPMRPPIFSSGPPYIQSMPLMPSIGTGFGMNTDTRVSMNMATMAMPPVMPPFGPAILYPHINQHIQAPILQITHQHMAAEMFPYSHAGDPYHFPSVVPGQVSPQVKTILPCTKVSSSYFYFRELKYASHSSSYSAQTFSILTITCRIQNFLTSMKKQKESKVDVLALVFSLSNGL